MIRVSSPTRVDLAGGTLDMWPLSMFVTRALTVNVAIDIYTHAQIEECEKIVLRSDDLKQTFEFSNQQELFADTRPELSYFQEVIRYCQPQKNFRLQTRSESPIGGGLGGSSSLMISLLKAFYAFDRREVPEVVTLTDIAHHLEAKILKTPTGIQDYVPAIQGGISFIECGVDGVKTSCLDVDPQVWNEHFLLVYTGRSHHSGLNNFEVLTQATKKNQDTLTSLQKLSDVAIQMKTLCQTQNWGQMPALFEQEYEHRLRLAPAFSSPEIKRLAEIASSFGIKSVKICGAGGGGCVLIWCPSIQIKKQIEDQCEKEKFLPMTAKPVPKLS